MNLRVALAALCGITCCLPRDVWAHPGHGTTEPHSLVHHTSEWLHVAPWWMAVAAAASMAIAWRLRRRWA